MDDTNSSGVKECLVRRGVSQDPICPLCHIETESINHALRDCELIKPIWVQLEFQTINQAFFTQNTREWLVTNYKWGKPHPNRLSTSQTIFLYAIWKIWKQRNMLVFKNKRPNPNLVQDIIIRQRSLPCVCLDPRG